MSKQANSVGASPAAPTLTGVIRLGAGLEGAIVAVSQDGRHRLVVGSTRKGVQRPAGVPTR